jgi:RNA polymerase sigma-70 factor (ECF subfamily)
MNAVEDIRDKSFEENRPLLFSIAYRMLGSAADAEDLVQDTYLRWRAEPRDDVQSPKHYLTTVITRQAINHLQSARVRREQYIGPWLPELVLTSAMRDPVELAESLTVAFLVLLESLGPVERAVFLLSEVFDYSMNEIAETTGKSVANCRQILHRARQAVRGRRRSYAVSDESVKPVVENFSRAVYAGDVRSLLDTLAADAVLYADGGGKVQAAINPIFGADRVARFLAGISTKGVAGTNIEYREINRQPGCLVFRAGVLEGAVTFDVADGQIQAIYLISNPDKLAALKKEEER